MRNNLVAEARGIRLAGLIHRVLARGVPVNPRVFRRRARVRRILEMLAGMYPDAGCALIYRNPFELLIAAMLSAQSTDKMVNRITTRLFALYPGPADFARLTEEELAREIRGVGLFRSKARNIIATCRILMHDHSGEVPRTRLALERLPGVGRKTANVVLSNAFGEPAIAVDTHVFRVANRLGLANARDPMNTERQLMRRTPRKLWSQAHHWLIHHGRLVCRARNPLCQACALAPLCRYARAHFAGQPFVSPDIIHPT